jgi:cytochrome c biogenesis protein CcmG, thiol:disulfide interchange protein DsbE
METTKPALDEKSPVERVLLPAGRKRSRKRSIMIFTLVSLLNVGLLALLWTQLLTPAHNSGGSGDGTAAGPLEGQRAPDFTLAALGGAQHSEIGLASFKGKPVVLNFWATSCPPCQEETPMLQSEWERAHTKGVIFLGVDFQDVQSDGLRFMQRYGVTYPNVLDSGGTVAIRYGVTYTPTTFFINRQGIVVRSIPREITAQELQSNLQRIL